MLLYRVGIELPTIEVRFEHLTVEANVNTGSRALPRVLEQVPSTSKYEKAHTILDDVSWYCYGPSRMTLLLGPPSSGKTTLLLALAGKLAKELKSSGKVTYNGHELHEFVPERTSAYISQNDVHIGEMTVRETLAFSARCQGVGSRYVAKHSVDSMVTRKTVADELLINDFLHDFLKMLAVLSEGKKMANIKPDPDIDIYMKAAATEGQEASVVTDYTLKLLGLDICADTMVGDQMIRGISGGQKKRVTTGEMIVGPSKVLLMDEISTGLDSSTTFQIVKSLKQFLHILEGTAVISLLQPAPETYDLFDDIILLTDGKIVYQGPRDNVLDFFESMGFKCPERKGVADFLQEVTSKKDQEQYWTRRDQPYRFVTAKEFADAYQSFYVGRKLGDDLGTPYDKTKSHPAALTTETYGLNKKELLKACTDREILLMKRNSFVYIFKLFQIIVMAFVAMTVFFRTEMHRRTPEDGGIYMGALFFGVVMIMFNGMAEISMTIVKLPVYYKQRDFLFYPSWAYALPSFFREYLLLLLVNQMSSGLFRFIGALGRNMIVANTFGSFALLLVFALGGFVLVRDDVKKWWLWGYWSSPMMYAMNGIVVNEFLGHRWKKPWNDSTLGKTIITFGGFFAEEYWYWIAIAALVGFILLFNLCFALSLALLDPFGKSQGNVASQDDSDAGAIEMQSNRIADEGSQNMKKGMILPFEPHSITFNDVKYSVDMPQEMREQGVDENRLLLLKGVSRKTGGYIEGDVRISGYPKVQETFARISGYCEQNDIHSPHVTVYESLLYSAWLRLATDVDEKTRKSSLPEVMDLVEMIPVKGCTSRGYQVSVGSQRTTEEWTQDVPVVCTIHQPSIDIFEAFDELFLMKQGGQELYVRPVGRHSCELIKYFEGIDGVSKIKDGYNPATWMLEVSTSSQELALGVDFTQIYDNSDLYRQNKALIAELSVPRMYLSVVDVEHTVFYRERVAGMYSALTYAFAQVLVEIPYILAQTEVYNIIVYAVIGFEWTITNFFWYCFF
ncbi:pleiotropic drug resistance protein 1-like protein [Tanacetum coccineum]